MLTIQKINNAIMCAHDLKQRQNLLLVAAMFGDGNCATAEVIFNEVINDYSPANIHSAPVATERGVEYCAGDISFLPEIENELEEKAEINMYEHLH